ncbi:MAG: TetR/AcrR family transcriptional regulator [Actinobacteria bacterium]|nr:TetR/AcrR family transcriptional regulator [Actinomycetota bacterium]
MGSDFVAVTDRQGGRNDSTNDLDTRERLVRAAIEVFLEKGYGGTRVQDIARRAGFTSGALYVHFPSRTALLGEAIMREGQTIMEQLANEVTSAGASGVSPAESLARLSSGEPTSLDLLLLEALALASRSDEAKEVLGQALNGFVSNLMVMIETSRERGDVGDDIDLEALRQIVVSWVFGGVVVKALGLATTSTDSLTHVTRRLLQGIGS